MNDQNIDWDNWTPQIEANLAFIKKDDQVLLIRKKTGFGKGKINGPGGKLEPNETPLQSAIRELQEELCITPLDLKEKGILRFQFTDGLSMYVTVFLGQNYTGTPTETIEAKPLWYPIDSIPFEEMWEDDQYWLPEILKENGKTFDSYWLFKGENMLWKKINWKM